MYIGSANLFKIALIFLSLELGGDFSSLEFISSNGGDLSLEPENKVIDLSTSSKPIV